MRQFKNSAIPVFALALIGAIPVAYATQWGPGVYPDSVVYLEGARNLAAGHGYVMPGPGGGLVPILHYPPGLPALLAILTAIGIQTLTAARFLNITLLPANILLVSLLVGKLTNWSKAYVLLAALITLGSPAMLTAHSLALTEPLFLFFLLTSMLLLADSLENQRTISALASAIIIGFAFLTRYQGVALIPAGVVTILILSREPKKTRYFRILMFLILSCTLPLSWFSRNRMVTGHATSAALAFHPFGYDQLNSALYAVAVWLVPESVSGLVKKVALTAFLIVFTTLGVALYKDAKARKLSLKESIQPLEALLALFIVSYSLLLVIATSFLYGDIAIDQRKMLPVFLCMLALMMSMCYRFLHKNPRLRTAFAVAPLLLLSGYGFQSWNFLITAHNEGLGYSSSVLKESSIIHFVASLPSETRIISNAPDAILFLTGHSAESIPVVFNMSTSRRNEYYEKQMSALRRSLQVDKGLLIYFHGMEWRSDIPSETQLRKLLVLDLVKRGSEASIYKSH